MRERVGTVNRKTPQAGTHACKRPQIRSDGGTKNASGDIIERPTTKRRKTRKRGAPIPRTPVQNGRKKGGGHIRINISSWGGCPVMDR